MYGLKYTWARFVLWCRWPRRVRLQTALEIIDLKYGGSRMLSSLVQAASLDAQLGNGAATYFTHALQGATVNGKNCLLRRLKGDWGSYGGEVAGYWASPVDSIYVSKHGLRRYISILDKSLEGGIPIPAWKNKRLSFKGRWKAFSARTFPTLLVPRCPTVVAPSIPRQVTVIETRQPFEIFSGAALDPARFDVDPKTIPDGMSYQWCRLSLMGMPDTRNIKNYENNHWKAVPRSRHPELESEDSGQIVAGGMLLMERPAYLVEEARQEGWDAAQGQLAIAKRADPRSRAPWQ